MPLGPSILLPSIVVVSLCYCLSCLIFAPRLAHLETAISRVPHPESFARVYLKLT